MKKKLVVEACCLGDAREARVALWGGVVPCLYGCEGDGDHSDFAILGTRDMVSARHPPSRSRPLAKF